MAADRRFTFSHRVLSSGFSQALTERVDAYFREHRLSKRADLEMVLKTIFGFAAWIGTYALLMTDAFSSLQVTGIYVLHGYAQLHMGLNIAHDANHNAYAKSKRVNRLLGRVFDLVGLSSYMWRLMHNDAHHVFVNVRGADSALLTGKLFRFTPHDQWHRFHRYQHLYAVFLYCLPTLDWVLFKDFRWFFSVKCYGNRRVHRHPPFEIALLFAGKIFYFTYMLVLPMLFLSVPWYAIAAAFVIMHCFLGFTLALTFQPNHFTPESAFPEPDEGGHISNNYIKHIFDTTVDYARNNAFVNWALGGLNLHVIHHMFPGICHTHYRALTKIIKTTAEEYGLRYRENLTITRAFLAHLRWLKILGSAD